MAMTNHHDSIGMNWSAESSEDTRDVLSRAISAQLARAREVLDSGTDPAASVHEARRPIKRARALLRLGPRGRQTRLSTARCAMRVGPSRCSGTRTCWS